MASGRAQHQQSTETTGATGASCVIWYRHPETNGVMVLVGLESRYVRDRHTSPKTEAEKEKLASLVTLEQFQPASKSEADLFKKDANAFKAAAKEKFEARVKKITAAEIATIKGNSASSASADTSHIRFQFDTPVRRKDGALFYDVRFRELKFDGPERQQPKLGIIKGGREDCDASPADTVVREVSEEVGITVNKSRLTNVGSADGYDCFSFQIDPGHVAEWEAVIARRHARNYGELFHLGFLPLREGLRGVPSSGRVTVTDVFERLPSGLILPPGYELGINRKTLAAIRLFLVFLGSTIHHKGRGGRKINSRKKRDSRRRPRRRYHLKSRRVL